MLSTISIPPSKLRAGRLGDLALLALGLLSCSGSGPVGPDGPALSVVVPTTSRLAATAGEPLVFEVRATGRAGAAATVVFRVDGTRAATGERFVWTPEAPGSHVVEAVAADPRGETRHAWRVEVAPAPNAAPTAALDVDPPSGPAPLAVRLRLGGSDADGAIARYRVEVGGDMILVLVREAPIDTTLVLGAGDYDVSATVEDDAGAVGHATAAVHVDPTPNQAPLPALTVDPRTGTAPLDVLVEGRGTDPDGSIARYELDLDGDGSFELDAATPLVQSLRFTTAVDRWIRLRVTDDGGASAHDSVRVVVQPPAAPPPPPPPPPPGNAAPSASLDVSPTTGPAPLSVHATVTASDPDGAVVATTLDFDGDGAPEATADGNELEADFTFEEPGTYTVRARVTDDDGATGQATVTVVAIDPNAPPSGALSASTATGAAPLDVVLSATGSDPDGTVVTWEIDPDDGGGWIEAPDRSLAVAYPYRDDPYRPRLRLTDDDGARTVVGGPEIRVLRPVSPTLSGVVDTTGNAHFKNLSIHPAIWADGSDRLRFTILVVDHAGQPLSDVPVRVRSLRPELVAPDGTPLGGTVTIQLDGTRTGADGRLTGSLTTRTSTRVEAAPTVGAWERFGLMFEAATSPDTWVRLPDLQGLNAETTVSGSIGDGEFSVTPEGVTCLGRDTLTIQVRGERRDDAPASVPQYVPGTYVEIRYKASGALLPVTPKPGYEGWRTGSDGRIRFEFVPQASDFRTLEAWVDGQPLNITRSLAVAEPTHPECQ